MMSGSDDNLLPFSERKQSAWLWHLSTSEAAFAKYGTRTRETMYSHPLVRRLWRMVENWQKQHQALPTYSDIAEHPLLITLDVSEAQSLVRTWAHARDNAATYSVAALEQEFGNWVKTKIYTDFVLASRAALEQNVKSADAEKLCEVWDIVRTGMKNIDDVSVSDTASVSVADLTRTRVDEGWLWDGILPVAVGDAGSLAATGGTGKSTLLTHYAVHAATGAPYLGRATRKGNTLIVSGEETRDTMIRRLQRAMTMYGVAPETVASSIGLVSTKGRKFSIVRQQKGSAYDVDAAGVAEIASHAKSISAQLVIIETASRYSADETNEGYRTLVLALEAIAKAASCTVLVVAHTAKGRSRGQASSELARGGMALSDNGRFSIGFTPDETAENLYWLDLTKCNSHKPGPRAPIMRHEPGPGLWQWTLRPDTEAYLLSLVLEKVRTYLLSRTEPASEAEIRKYTHIDTETWAQVRPHLAATGTNRQKKPLWTWAAPAPGPDVRVRPQ